MAERTCYDYPRPAVTADIVLLSGDAVLLIKRRLTPFEGCWALPGGFMDIDETLADAAARELEEETGITGVPLRQLRVFDAPGRDPRGRTISVVFLADIGDRPKPRAGDDAAEARWHLLDRLPPVAFDHETIIMHAVADAERAA